MPVAAGEPERQAELAHLREVHDVALAVERLARSLNASLTARRRVVAAGGRALRRRNRPRARSPCAPASSRASWPRRSRGTGAARADGRARQCARGSNVEQLGVAGLVSRRRRACIDVGSCCAERIEHAGNLARYACAHQHVVHAGEHRAVQRCEVRHLHLRQQVDPDHAVVALLREPHLDEVGQHRHLLSRDAHRLPVHREHGVRAVPPGVALRQEVLRRAPRSPTSGIGKCAIARRTCPPTSPSCSRRTSTVSIAVPETTPSCPRRDTVRASVQLETPIPMPP